jgi:hypothetical protein
MSEVRLEEAGEEDVFLWLFNQPSVQACLDGKRRLRLCRLHFVRLLVVLVMKGL